MDCTAGGGQQTIAVDVLLSFAAALVSLRLAGRLLRAARIAWAGGLLSFAAAAGGDGLGRRARLGRGVVPRLLPRGRAPLGAAAGHRLAAALAPAPGPRRSGSLYTGLAVGVALTMDVHGTFDGTAVPQRAGPRRRPAPGRRDRASSLGALAVVVVAVATLRRRPRANALVVGAVAAAAAASALTQTAVSAAAACFALAARAARRRRSGRLAAPSDGDSSEYQATTRSANSSSAVSLSPRLNAFVRTSPR